MKKFDFVAELLAHGFHDDTKLEAVELSRQTGFEGVVLSRDFTKVMFNEAGQAVYFNRVMKNGREQFVVKALDGQHIMGRDRQKHSSRTFTELHQAEAFLRRAGYRCKG